MIGSLIFLTKRKIKNVFDYRGIISVGISKLTKFKDQDEDEVKVHTAIIYDNNGELTVREMGKHGDEHYSLEYYKIMYGSRMEIVYMQETFNLERIDMFNKSCKYTKVKYDYKNTFVFQLIKSFTHKFFGKDTLYHRMCAEDAQRQYNILFPNYFKTPEDTNPNELYKIVKTY